MLSLPGFLQVAGAALRAGGARLALHLRGPRTAGRILHDLGSELARMAAGSGGRLLVNDRIDVALACGADGVHLGGRSLSPGDARRAIERMGGVSTGIEVPAPGRAPDGRFWIGASVHSVEEAESAATAAVDFLLVGSVFPTASHPGARPLGPEGLAEVGRAAGDRPVLGIGGITPSRVPEVLIAGAGGVAVLGGVWDAPDPPEAVLAYLAALESSGADRDRPVYGS